MPFCVVGDDAGEVIDDLCDGKPTEGRMKIFYQLYGYGDTKVLLIPGVAATVEAWGPQLVDLCGTDVPNQEEALRNGYDVCSDDERRIQSARELVGVSGNGIQVCALDNRGAGRSSKPKGKQNYSTTIMARDALRLMDHLGWERAYVAGHSMGGMIAFKLTAIVPDRVLSLAILSTTGGGYQCLPKIDRTMIRIAYRFLRAKTPEERANVDLDTHYTKDYLDTLVGDEYRRAVLYKEYVKNLSNSGLQPKHGLDGQFNACWNHRITSHEVERIRSVGVRVVVLHGRGDIVAQVRHARNIARKLHPVSRMIELPGGHMITHQNTKEVNEALLAMIRDELPEGFSEGSDEPLYVKGWKIWQRGNAEDGKAINNFLDCCYVGSVVEVVKKIWPQWLSILYVFPSIYWSLTWAHRYIQSS